MIKVVFEDLQERDMIVIAYNRKELKYDPMKRMRFAGDVNHAIAHFIGKLREELKREKP